MRKYWLITYGCQMNKSDSERITSVLEDIGYLPASEENEADLIVVNMCSVRQSAVNRIFGICQKFSKLKIKNKKLKTILTGCILKEDKKKFKKGPAPHRAEGSGAGFDLILDIKNLPKWPKILKLSKNSSLKVPPSIKSSKSGVRPRSIELRYQNRFRAFIPIMTGCDNFCTFCVVPYTRGPEVSREAEEILAEIRTLVKRGFKEIWLLGQNVNSYGIQLRTDAEQKRRTPHQNKFGAGQADAEVNFAKLLRMVNEIPGNFWIRFTSPNPKNFSEELIETMARCNKVTPYLNLPVQSGDNEILRKMNRPYAIEYYKNLVKKIRSKFAKIRKGFEKEISLSTDIIVGFPGETKKQFENTKKVIGEIGFATAYIAPYSPRPQTAAFKLFKDNVSPDEKKKRQKELNEIIKKSALKFNKKFLGKIVNVLIDKKRKNFYLGKTKHHQTIKIKTNKEILGKFIKARVVKIMPYGLEGKLIR